MRATTEMSLKTLSRTVLALSIGALVACSSTPEMPTPVSERVESRTCEFPKSTEEAPEWVCPWWISDGDIAATGTYGPSDAPYDFQVRMATLRARHTIVENLLVKFKGSTSSLFEAMGEGNGESLDAYHRQVASQLSAMDLSGARIHDAVNGPDGTLYVLVALDRKLAAEQLKQMSRSSLNNPHAQWQEEKGKKALAELDAAIDKEFGLATPHGPTGGGG